MKGNEFKRWALRGCRIYGDDEWFFLRELAQNARDAGASLVTVDCLRDGDDEVLVFADDGSGMALDHAQQFLFRLYASSKEDERGSAGQFGIGFWAVLRFAPELLTIASNDGHGAWAVRIDQDFDLEPLPAPNQARGTTVTMRRRAAFGDEESFVAEVRQALVRFCRYLRRNDTRASPLPVHFKGENILSDMSLPGPLSLRFKTRSSEGVVGLAPRPSVELFARGLPVWKGMLLDELSYRGTDLSWRGEIAQGLAPVFVLNGNRLNVVMSRNAVVDDGALAGLRKQAGAALEDLVRHQLQKTLPAGPWYRFKEWLRAALVKLGRIPVVTLVPIVLAALMAVGIWYALPHLRNVFGVAGPTSVVPGSAPPVGADVVVEADHDGPAPARLPTVYRGSVVDQLPSSSSLELTYDPPDDHYFKFLTATEFNSHRGFVAAPAKGAIEPMYYLACAEGPALSVEVSLDQSGLVALPVPTGYGLHPTQPITATPHQVALEGQTPTGEPLLRLFGGQTTLSYAVCPAVADAPQADQSTTGVLASLEDEEAIERLRRLATGTMEKRVEEVLEVVRSRLVYDDSPEAAGWYAELDGDEDWLTFVLEFGRGDCDVMNALAVLLLRELGVPARLAIGSRGRQGRLEGGLHAWVEYYDRGWKVADATDGLAVVRLRDESPATGLPGPAAGGRSTPANLAAEGGRSTPANLAAEGGQSTPANLAAEGGQSSRDVSGEQGTEPVSASDGGPVAGASQEAAARGIPEPHRPFPWGPAGAALGGLLLTAMLMVTLRNRRRSVLDDSLDDARSEALLGDMALSAASQPGAWAHAEALWRHPLLPLLGSGRRMSLRAAERQALRGHLFAGGKSGPASFAHQAALAGTPVLDAGNRAFGRLAGQLAGIIDLDRVEALRPMLETFDAAGTLMGDANRTLGAAGGARVPLVVAPGLEEQPFLDVDLRAARLPAGWRGCRRFVAVRPDDVYREWLEVYRSDRAAAIYGLIDAVSRTSRYYRKQGALVRARAARLLLARRDA